MCNLYSQTKGPKAIRDLVNAMAGQWRDSPGNFEPQPSIFPDQLAPVVRTTPDGGLELLMMRWGFPSPTNAQAPFVTNVRNTKSHWWSRWLRPEYRCLVPATSFCEWTDSRPKVTNWFALDEARSLFFFAGVWRPWTGTRGTVRDRVTGEHLLFSFLTTEPNAEVKSVHQKAMPVLLLTKDERETWMTALSAEALGLQRSAPDGSLTIVATGSTSDIV
jgi:putative SOS response-associated peptidase YedK